MRRVSLVLAAITTSMACVHVSKSILSDRSMYPIAQSDVFVFIAGDTIPAACERVALLHGSGADGFVNESNMIDALRKEAGKLGANAIVLQSVEEAGTGEKLAAGLLGTSADMDGDAVAVWCPEGARG
jgi:hypothetical protein